MTEPDEPRYVHTVTTRDADGNELPVTFGPAEGAIRYSEYWTGPRPWWKRAWRRLRRRA